MRTFKIALAAALLWAIPAAAQQTEVRTYHIHHALFGDIGELKDEITRTGNETRVVMRADIRVDVLGITLHHMRAEWDETWQDGILQAFHAMTTRNGTAQSVSGQHQDGKFVVRVGEREFDAPAGVQPVHPWSPQFVRAATLMSPESGRIFAADFTEKGYQSMRIGGASRRVRHYVLRSDTTNHLYFDDDGSLLLAEYRDITGGVTLTLQAVNEPRVASSR